MPQKIIELKKLCNDHMSHLNIEIFGTFGPILLSLNECVIENVEFVELGSSFMSSAKKLDLCSFCLNKSLDLTKLHMSAIDHSEYFMRGAMIFNSKYKIKAISDFDKYKSVFPIWGEPIVSYKDLGKFIRENSRYNNKINYKFNLSQLNYYIKELLKSS